LHKQALHVGERRRFIMFDDMQELQLAPSRERDPQRMGKRRATQVGKIRRMQDRADGSIHENRSKARTGVRRRRVARAPGALGRGGRNLIEIMVVGLPSR
jgi:hypothetical protein